MRLGWTRKRKKSSPCLHHSIHCPEALISSLSAITRFTTRLPSSLSLPSLCPDAAFMSPPRHKPPPSRLRHHLAIDAQNPRRQRRRSQPVPSR
ncbi:hypothetical protein M0R45_008015 [Rubus argutus]|uniref:Uncharacterized protein n=1 Tax=Rubus argutus TaxID=59490 RepID=A0AAW1Y2X3_RUBAR